MEKWNWTIVFRGIFALPSGLEGHICIYIYYRFWWQLSTDPDQVHKPESVLRVALFISILFLRSFFSFNLLLFLVSRLIIHLQVFEVRKWNFLASWISHIVHVNSIPATARVSKCVSGIPADCACCKHVLKYEVLKMGRLWCYTDTVHMWG